MTASSATKPSAVLRRLFPLLWDDSHFLAVGKPARVNLESPAWKHGPRVIDVVAAQYVKGIGDADDGAALLPLVLPERLLSGLALFARSEEAARRFAGMAETNKLRYLHAAVVRGTPPRPKIALKPTPAAKADKRAGRAPAKLPAAALVQILDSHDKLHVAECQTTAAALDDVRRLFKAAGGLEIVGDIRPSPFAAQRRTNPARRPIVHLVRLSFPHPFEKCDVEIVDRTPRAFKSYLTAGVLLEEHLRAALAARLTLIVDDTTTAYRLITGRNEGVAGLVADRLGSAVVLEMLGGIFQGDEQQMRQVSNWYARMLGAQAVYARQVPQRAEKASASARGPQVQLLRGDETADLVVLERGVRYAVKPSAGLAVGLYLDQRENRRRIAQLAAGKDMLNLFAYTCGFSVAAAAGGAKSTTSVDLATGNLEWGKENFAANGISLDNHSFIRSDAFEFFKRARRQQRKYDVIVLDPPTFARAKKPRRTFEIKKHLTELIGQATELLRSSGHLLISTNYRQVSLMWMIAQVESAITERPFRIVAKPKLPADFAADPDFQKSLLVRVD